MTPSELKSAVEAAGESPHFFTRKAMQFFGDTMRNYGVRSATVKTHYDTAGNFCAGGATVEAWELYRKHPVKHGVNGSAYFDKQTFARVHGEAGR